VEYRFLLVSLNIDAVLEEVTISQRKKKLEQMIKGGGLRDAYSATLERIKAQKGSKARLGIEVLMWLSHSERPLNANELCHALGVEIGSTDLDYQNIPAIETLLGCSLGLVIVEASSHTVRLVHYTLKEYLSNNANLFPSPHSAIAEVCLTYLNFQCIGDLSPIPGEPSRGTPLLEYASCYWGIHARSEITQGVNKLALRLLDRFENHVSSAMLLSNWGDNWDRKLRRSNSMGFTGLHGAAHLGIVETTVALLEMKKWDLSATDVAGNTAILWAARRGHGAIVKILLASNGFTGNIPDTDGRTPLSWAAGNGHGGIVKMLLERGDVTPDIADGCGRTPLSWAAGYGNEDVVKMLLEREDVTPDTADRHGRTPLSWVAEVGNEDAAVRFLEREDVAPGTADKDGRTPLSWAANKGHEGIVKMLLEREDITPDTPDNDGRTPLSWAASLAHKGIVKLLLEQEDVAPDTPDRNGRTPLSWAAEFGREGITKMLLKCEDVAPDTTDKRGQTPHSWAAKNGHTRVMGMLRERSIVGQDIVTAPASQIVFTRTSGKQLPR